jgi:hypothetical protein
MSLYDPDHEADLRQEFAPCRLCRGSGVVRDRHGFTGGPAEESECGCREAGEVETEEAPCCAWCGRVVPEGPALGSGQDSPLCVGCAVELMGMPVGTGEEAA